MERITKITLVFLGVLLVVGLCVGAGGLVALQRAGQTMGQPVLTDPDEVSQVAARIADYELPPGTHQTAMNMMGFEIVYISTDVDQDGKLILLMQFPEAAGLVPEEMSAQMQRSMEQQFGQRGFEMKPVGSKSMRVRGQEVTFQISEGAGANGDGFRQMTGLFEGRDGMVMVAITGPISTWNDKEIEAFLTSMR